MDYTQENERAENEENAFEELVSQMYYNEKNDKRDYLFSLSVFQAVVCIILTAVIFLMSLMGGYKKEMIKAIDYFQSFNLTKSDITDEIDAMKSFLSDDKV